MEKNRTKNTEEEKRGTEGEIKKKASASGTVERGSAEIFPEVQQPPYRADGEKGIGVPVLEYGFVSAVPDDPPGCSQESAKSNSVH